MFKHEMAASLSDSEFVEIKGFSTKDGYTIPNVIVTTVDGLHYAGVELTAHEARQLASVLLNAADYIEREG